MSMFTNTMAWAAEPYAAQLPPPLCFTVPAGVPATDTQAPMKAGGGLGVTLRTPKLAMDPSDPATWQRPYVFTR